MQKKKRIINKMINAFVNFCLFLALAYLALTIPQTYAFITQSDVKDIYFQMDEMTSLITSSDTIIENTVDLSGLVYFDLNDLSMLNSMAISTTFTIYNDSEIEQRIQIKLSDVSNGLMYLVVDSNEIDYKTIIEQTSDGLSSGSMTSTIEGKVDYHNHQYLSDLYEGLTNVLQPNSSRTIKIVYFGDYDSLSAQDKSNYLNLSFNPLITIKTHQVHPLRGSYDYDLD